MSWIQRLSGTFNCALWGAASCIPHLRIVFIISKAVLVWASGKRPGPHRTAKWLSSVPALCRSHVSRSAIIKMMCLVLFHHPVRTHLQSRSRTRPSPASCSEPDSDREWQLFLPRVLFRLVCALRIHGVDTAL